MSAWLYLSFAIALEVSGTFLLKLSNGFEKTHWGMLSILCFCGCFAVLAPAMKVLPVSIVYAIWAGVGILAASLIGLIAFGERLTLFQIGCVVLILAGSIGLRLTTPH